ncbi:MAG: hypothetical protein RIQ97_1816 [Pseudomonadota bacterium]|jgi:hypothetical protein
MTIDANGAFSATYAQARARFVQAAAQAGAELRTCAHPLRGLQDEALAMDLAWLGPRQARRVLVSLSGTHGIEGFAGSACQLAWLSSGHARALPPDTAVWLVHAVNPWGFSWLRRVNEDNIDVNRNALAPGEPLPHNPDYAHVHTLMQAAGHSPQALLAQVQGLMQQWGPRRTTRAITGGQASHADGLFFCGLAPCWSVRQLAQAAAQALAGARQVAVLDHHTGLGPRGHTEIICRHPADSLALRLARRWWGEDTTATELGESSSEVIDGNVRMAFARWCPDALVVAAALEVGTQPPEQVLRALLADHQWHQQSPAVRTDAAPVQQAMRAAFAPEDAAWRQACVQRAMALYAATLDGLQTAEAP